MTTFKDTPDAEIVPAPRVLELDGRAGLPDCFATRRTVKVFCIGLSPDPDGWTHMHAMNDCGARIGVRHAGSFECLPPEPVDLVICERPRSGASPDGQPDAIDRFKSRYRQRFGDRLPLFMPAATLLAVQPLHQEYERFGFRAPIIRCGGSGSEGARAIELAAPVICGVMDDSSPYSRDIAWQGSIGIRADGIVNALRFVTRNIRALIGMHNAAQDRQTGHLVLPLPTPVRVQAGDTLRVSFDYGSRGSLHALARTLRADVVARVCGPDRPPARKGR